MHVKSSHFFYLTVLFCLFMENKFSHTKQNCLYVRRQLMQQHFTCNSVILIIDSKNIQMK